MRSNKTTLSLFIMKAYRTFSFVSAYLYGFQGSGKTTYALLTLYSIYQDWRKVKEHFFMKVDELEAFLRGKLDEGERIPCVVLDDAGVPLIKYSWRTQKAKRFAKVFNLARSITGGFVFTSVGLDDIIQAVRSKIMYRVSVTKLSERYSKATGYKLYVTPLLQEGVSWAFEDVYPIRSVPQDIREWAEDLKREVIREILEKEGLEANLSEKEILERIEKRFGLLESSKEGSK